MTTTPTPGPGHLLDVLADWLANDPEIEWVDRHDLELVVAMTSGEQVRLIATQA